MSDREELEKILYRSALSKLRFGAIAAVWFLVFCMPDLRSIYSSMNVELPHSTKLLIWMADALQDFWFVLVPCMWVGWRLWEERALRRLSHQTMEWMARLVWVTGLMLLYQGCFGPLLKLICSVG